MPPGHPEVMQAAQLFRQMYGRSHNPGDEKDVAEVNRLAQQVFAQNVNLQQSTLSGGAAPVPGPTPAPGAVPVTPPAQGNDQ